MSIDLLIYAFRYILLPALLGYFTSKQTLTPDSKGDMGSFRKEVIEKSQVST
mgnify:CR=1 FL=1